MIIQRLNHKLTIYWHIDDMDYTSPAVCYDCMCLISSTWTMISLSYDGDGVLKWTGHNGGYDCSPAGILGCLPRWLCLPWVMGGMTQYLMKILGHDLDMMLSKTMHAGDVCVPVIHHRRHVPIVSSVEGILLALIGRQASVGGLVGLAYWPRVLGAVDKLPGGVWIDFIRQALEDSQSIVAVPVTGLLVSPTLFSCRDAICTTIYSIYWIVCDMD